MDHGIKSTFSGLYYRGIIINKMFLMGSIIFENVKVSRVFDDSVEVYDINNKDTLHLINYNHIISFAYPKDSPLNEMSKDATRG